MQPGKPSARPTAAQSLVRDLVNQFSDPLAFYRELIQNAIDAGANRIDVTLEYRSLTPDPPGAPPAWKDTGMGKAVIRVEDDGEGMDEGVIDDFLLVLFKSTKEDDLTKIGKFGIGFVSVFSLEPEQVRVWTAKNGQSWRLDFPSYKRYEKYRLKDMRDSTLVEVSKPMSIEEYQKLVMDSRWTVRYWCKHADARIFFEDKMSGREPQPIVEPFDLEGGASLRYDEEGTEVVLGFTSEPQPVSGYYNRGLTLKEGRAAPSSGLEGLRFKIKSRWLEHTLTRDNVLMDGNYAKAMAIVRRLAEEGMPKALKAELEALALVISRQPTPPPEDDPTVKAWAERLTFLRILFSGPIARWRRSDWPIFPTLSGPASLSELKRCASSAGRLLYLEPERNRVTALLGEAGQRVLPPGPWVEPLAAWSRSTPVKASEALIAPEILPEGGLSEGVNALLDTLRALDGRSGSKYTGIVAADFGYAGSCIRDAIFVTQKVAGTLTPAAERPVSSLFRVGRARHVALLNAGHDVTARLARLHARRPGLAGYLALKMMYLYDGDVPADRHGDYCNLAEKVEGRLLENALALEL